MKSERHLDKYGLLREEEVNERNKNSQKNKQTKEEKESNKTGNVSIDVRMGSVRINIVVAGKQKCVTYSNYLSVFFFIQHDMHMHPISHLFPVRLYIFPHIS